MKSCPYCGGSVTEIDPVDENLDDHGHQIREFECDDCEEVLEENQLEDDSEEGTFKITDEDEAQDDDDEDDDDEEELG